MASPPSRHYLTWSKNGSHDGELVFVAGHPGRTDRLNTLASLQNLRDVGVPAILDYLHNKEAFLLDYGKRGAEAFRQSKEDLFGIQNSRKARVGGLEGLRDPGFMARKEQAEKELRSRVATDARKQAAYGAAWERIAEAQKTAARLVKPFNLIERGFAFDSTLFRIARVLVRLADENAKPNSDRLREYRELRLAVARAAAFFRGAHLPRVRRGKTRARPDLLETEHARSSPGQPGSAGPIPEATARELVRNSKLADIAVRKKLAEGGKAAIEHCDDPMIKLALLVDADSRAVRKEREDKVEGVEASNYALIARALFEDKGDSVYPDATFTLRLAFGVVKGYELDGKLIPPYTTIGGAFEHAEAHGNKEPYALPASWHEAKKAAALILETPLNFVSTADIIGGNSGSPVVNRDNEVVGLIFDGNIQSLVLDFGYDDKIARAVSVDSRGIVEALRSIYHADRLVKELAGE